MSRFNNNRIIKELDIAIEKAESSGTAQDAIQAMRAAREMLSRKDEFTVSSSTRHSDTLEKIQTQTFQHDWAAEYEQGKTHEVFIPVMLCGPVEGQFLKSLVSIHKAKRVLEVGMFTGYSALSMAEALPADGEVVTLDICGRLKTLVEDWTKDSPHAKKIRIEIGPGLETVTRMADKGEQFDMMFFDGEKSDYIPLLQMAFDRNLLGPGGTVLIDNAFHHGAAFVPSDNLTLAHDLAKLIKSSPELHSVLVPMNDGVLMVRRMEDVEGK